MHQWHHWIDKVQEVMEYILECLTWTEVLQLYSVMWRVEQLDGWRFPQRTISCFRNKSHKMLGNSAGANATRSPACWTSWSSLGIECAHNLSPFASSTSLLRVHEDTLENVQQLLANLCR
jgi:hypothetical protein